MANIVKYEAKDGQSVELTFETIKRYLVHGKSELVTNQEMIFFMGICKARGLNPFAKDCYLIKYSNDPAAIVTSIDYFRARAKAQRDCRGWESGIIVEDADGNIRYSKGLIKKNETLLGGWFRARPKDWDHDFDLEVNLSGYIKKTKEGNITKFWQSENQPTMIRKVAESQGLREIWPDEFAKLYVEEEIDRTEMRENLFGIDLDKSDDKTKNGEDIYIYNVKETQHGKVTDLDETPLDDSNLTKTEAEKAKELAEANERLKQKQAEEKNRNQEFPCPHCEFVGATERGLNKHINAKHIPENTAQAGTLVDAEWKDTDDSKKSSPDQSSAISQGILKRKEEEKQENGYIRCPFNQNKAKAVKICRTCTEKEKCQPYQEYLYENPPE